MWPAVLELQQQRNGAMYQLKPSGIKVTIFDLSALVYICLHSSSASSKLVYTRLVTRLISFTFVYIRLGLVRICLNSSTLV